MPFLPLQTVLPLLALALLFPFVESKRTSLNEYIDHYEQLHFNSRVRRSFEETSVLRLDFAAHNKNFSLRLRSDYGVFHPNVEFVSVSSGMERKINFDKESMKTGYVHGHTGSRVHGRYDNGIFDGIVHIPLENESYFIEPSRKYFQYAKFDAVIFKLSDINAQKMRNATRCAASKTILEKMKKIQESAPNDDDVRRQKREDPAEQNTCYVHLAADHLFFSNVAGGSEADAISEMTIHLNDADHIYRNTDFLGRRVGLAIARITVYTSENEPRDGYANIKDSSKFLDLWSRENQDAYCLAMLFTYTDFSGGVLGLAWVASTGSTAGGICQKEVTLSAGKRSLNTAIVTLLNFESYVPRGVSTVTVAHEFGHNFGSQHDPDTTQCSPRGDYYIMYARATDGDQPNNDLFSPCSISSMSAVIKAKAARCFRPSYGSFCGNKIVEPGEECDCGFANECESVDPCCTPKDPSSKDDTSGCTIRRDKGYECSPKAGKCCNESCKIMPKDETTACRKASDCRKASFCNGTSPTCPAQVSHPNGKLCNSDTNTCFNGKCTGSICSLIGYTECLCDEHEGGCDDKVDERCHVCCQESESTTCLSTFCNQLQRIDMNLTGVYRAAGKSCQNYEGYCDKEGTCQGVDNDEVFKTLKDLFNNLFSSGGIAQWFRDNWLVVIGIVVGIALLGALLHMTYRRKKPIRNMARKAANSMRRKKEEKGKQDKGQGQGKPPKKADPKKTLIRLRNIFPHAQHDTLKDIMYHSPSEEAAVKKLLTMGFLMRRW